MLLPTRSEATDEDDGWEETPASFRQKGTTNFLKKNKIGPNHVKTEVAKFLPTFTTSEDSTGLSSEEVVAEIEALVELFSELCWITPSAVALWIDAELKHKMQNFETSAFKILKNQKYQVPINNHRTPKKCSWIRFNGFWSHIQWNWTVCTSKTSSTRRSRTRRDDMWALARLVLPRKPNKILHTIGERKEGVQGGNY